MKLGFKLLHSPVNQTFKKKKDSCRFGFPAGINLIKTLINKQLVCALTLI
jgi:hypothetical protein